MGLAAFSSGIGALACPPVILLLFKYYGFTGLFLIFGGCALHICVAGALFRPLEPSTRVLATTVTEQEEVFLPESERNHETISGNKETFLNKDDGNTSLCNTKSKVQKDKDTPVHNRTFKERYKILFKCPPFLGLMFVMFTLCYCLSLMSGFLPAIAVENGVGEKNAAFILSIK